MRKRGGRGKGEEKNYEDNDNKKYDNFMIVEI